MDSASSRNIGLRPVRQADILSAFDSHGNGVQLRWAHRPGGLCSVPAEGDRLAVHSTALKAGSVLPRKERQCGVCCNRRSQIYNRNQPARVAELADAPDLGSGAERRAGSSPVSGTVVVFNTKRRSRHQRAGSCRVGTLLSFRAQSRNL